MTDVRRLALIGSAAASLLVLVLIVVDAPQSLRALVVFPYLLVVPGLPWAIAFRLGTRMLTFVVAMSLSLALATAFSSLSYTAHTARGTGTFVLLSASAVAGVYFERRIGPRFAVVETPLEKESS